MDVKIPVKYVNGTWELLYGGPLPVADNSSAELTVSTNNITDERFRDALTKTRWVPILGAETQLYVAITADLVSNKELTKLFVDPKSFKRSYTTAISTSSQFVPVHISAPTDHQVRRGVDSGGLWLKFQGMKDCGIESSTIRLPDLPGRASNIVNSLNHALTVLSEVFEDKRISHTGSVYRRIYYEDSDHIWYPLGDLRDREKAAAERLIIRNLWDGVLAQMPSNPFESPDAPRTE